MRPEPIEGVTIAPVVHVHRAAPDLLSQSNVEDATGIGARAYLRELLPQYREAGGEVAERGKLRLVRREDFVRWLMSARAVASPASTPKGDAADELARDLGLAAVVPMRRVSR